MNFSNRLRKIRELRGLNSKDVAYALGVAPSTYSQYETGSREPDVIKIQAISQFLKISADYLLFGVEYPFDNDVDGIKLYKSLDLNDKAEIRGEMKQMLKAEKYTDTTPAFEEETQLKHA